MSGFLDQRANLAGKTAAVIGGGGGIGEACTRALAGAGVDVVFCDVDAEALEATRERLEAMGRLIGAHHVDATEPDPLDGFYDRVAEATTRLDIVVNVVGGTRRRRFMDVDRAANARDIQRNYGYVVQSVERAVELIRRSGSGGSIVNFTTIEAHRGAATFAVYAGAKAATTNFSRAMAVELAAERIRINCLASDTTLTRGNADALPPEAHAVMAGLPEAVQARGLEIYVPQQAPPSLDAVADGVLFLASDLSAAVTGTTLHVDGGTMAAAGFIDWPFGDGPAPRADGGHTRGDVRLGGRGRG